jgi:hypothetical protein
MNLIPALSHGNLLDIAFPLEGREIDTCGQKLSSPFRFPASRRDPVSFRRSMQT